MAGGVVAGRVVVAGGCRGWRVPWPAQLRIARHLCGYGRKMATPRRTRPAKPARDDDTPLRDYRAKRDPARTPEPMGADRQRGQRGADRPAFVIQDHHARALHWDFRLERDGVLASWALPKGVPEDPASNHLAV